MDAKSKFKPSPCPPGLDKEGRADQVSSSPTRRPSYSSSDEDAGFGAVPGTGKEGQEQGGPKWPLPQRYFRHIIRRYLSSLSSHDEDEEYVEENNYPLKGGKKKRGDSTDLEAEASKKGKLSLSDDSESDAEAVPELNPRPKPSAES